VISADHVVIALAVGTIAIVAAIAEAAAVAMVVTKKYVLKTLL